MEPNARFHTCKNNKNITTTTTKPVTNCLSQLIKAEIEDTMKSTSILNLNNNNNNTERCSSSSSSSSSATFMRRFQRRSIVNHQNHRAWNLVISQTCLLLVVLISLCSINDANGQQLAGSDSGNNDISASWQANGADGAAVSRDIVGPISGKLTGVDVICGKHFMTVRAEFSSPFYGIIFSKGTYGHENCIYLKPNTGITHTTFNINYDQCGTKPDLQGKFYENTIVVQYGPDIIEAYDEAKRLRCEWFEAYEKPATFRPAIPVADLDVVEMNFQGDDIDCWMEIQEGKGPWSREVSKIVSVGSPMTIVVAINDYNGQFDMRVKSCLAHDGVHHPIALTDEFGCVLRPKMLTPFVKIKQPGAHTRATVISYAQFLAFKFPDSMNVQIQCTVEVCRHGCADACQRTPSTVVRNLQPELSLSARWPSAQETRQIDGPAPSRIPLAPAPAPQRDDAVNYNQQPRVNADETSGPNNKRTNAEPVEYSPTAPPTVDQTAAESSPQVVQQAPQQQQQQQQQQRPQSSGDQSSQDSIDRSGPTAEVTVNGPDNEPVANQNAADSSQPAQQSSPNPQNKEGENQAERRVQAQATNAGEVSEFEAMMQSVGGRGAGAKFGSRQSVASMTSSINRAPSTVAPSGETDQGDSSASNSNQDDKINIDRSDEAPLDSMVLSDSNQQSSANVARPVVGTDELASGTVTLEDRIGGPSEGISNQTPEAQALSRSPDSLAPASINANQPSITANEDRQISDRIDNPQPVQMSNKQVESQSSAAEVSNNQVASQGQAVAQAEALPSSLTADINGAERKMSQPTMSQQMNPNNEGQAKLLPDPYAQVHSSHKQQQPAPGVGPAASSQSAQFVAPQGPQQFVPKAQMAPHQLPSIGVNQRPHLLEQPTLMQQPQKAQPPIMGPVRNNAAPPPMMSADASQPTVQITNVPMNLPGAFVHQQMGAPLPQHVANINQQQQQQPPKPSGGLRGRFSMISPHALQAAAAKLFHKRQPLQQQQQPQQQILQPHQQQNNQEIQDRIRAQIMMAQQQQQQPQPMRPAAVGPPTPINAPFMQNFAPGQSIAVNPVNGPQQPGRGRVPLARLRRSTSNSNEMGVKGRFMVVTGVDLAFSPNATGDSAPILEGRRISSSDEDIVYGVCMPIVSLAFTLTCVFWLIVFMLTFSVWMIVRARRRADQLMLLTSGPNQQQSQLSSSSCHTKVDAPTIS